MSTGRELRRLSNRQMVMKVVAVVAVLLVSMSACNGSGDATPPDSTPLAASTEQPEPAAAESTDASAVVVDDPVEQSSSDVPSVVEILDISYTCGGNDDLWAEVVVVASEPVSVFAEFAFEGTAYGRSELVALTPGEQHQIGFYPRRPNDAYQKTGTVKILEAGATTPSATTDAVPELPDGVDCG